MTAVCYIIIGAIGYIGFSGQSFDEMPQIEMTQNLLNLFPPRHILAIITRISLFCQLMLVFPLLYHIMSIQIAFMLHKKSELPTRQKILLNIVLIGFNTVLGALYPQVGSFIGLVGSILGLNLMYIIPISVYLKRYYLEIITPELAEALDHNQIQIINQHSKFITPQIAIIQESESESEESDDKQSGSKAGINTNHIESKILELKKKLQRRREKQYRSKKKVNKNHSSTPLMSNPVNNNVSDPTLTEGLISSRPKVARPSLKEFYIS